MDSVATRNSQGSLQPLLQQGLSGMKKSQREMVESAGEIAAAGTTGTGTGSRGGLDIAEPLIEMKVQRHVFDASARVVKAADETLGSLLDIKA